jgi:uncharacterized protein (TIGR02271 family)
VAQASSQKGSLVLPVVQEELKVGKQTVDTGGGVRLRKHRTRHTEQVEVPVWREDVVVERVPRDVMLQAGQPQPEPRQEGDTLVVPVLEEVPVVVKRLRLKEEVRITRRRHEERASAKAELTREDVSVTRLDDEGHEPSK